MKLEIPFIGGTKRFWKYIMKDEYIITVYTPKTLHKEPPRVYVEVSE